MNAFEHMTGEEQKQWWRTQAQRALQHFKMADARLEWLAYTHNAVFDVKHDENHYVLHLVDAIRGSTMHNLILLFRDLQAKAGLCVPQVVSMDYIVNLEDEVLNTRAILFEFMAGHSPVADSVTPAQISAVGAFLGKLHRFGDYWFDLAGLLPELDFNGLFGKLGLYHPGDDNMAVFTVEQMAVMATVARKVKAAMDELGRDESEFGLIHGDLLLKNVLFHAGEVCALDFEYCGWGYYLYDLTPLLWQLKPQARYVQLEQALWDGYTPLRPLTKRHRELLETLIAARQVASMRWIAANQHNPHVRGKVESILTQRTAELQSFLETGILNRS